MLNRPLLSCHLTFSKSVRSISISCRATRIAVCLSDRQSVLPRTVRAAVLVLQSSSCRCCVTSDSRPCRAAAYEKPVISFCGTIKDHLGKTTLHVEAAAPVGQRSLCQQCSPGLGLKCLGRLSRAAGSVSVILTAPSSWQNQKKPLHTVPPAAQCQVGSFAVPSCSCLPSQASETV